MSPTPSPRRIVPSALSVTAAVVVLVGCWTRPGGDVLFVERTPRETGIRFANRLSEGPLFNIINYQNYYNGAGVAAGDVDGDGRVDLYFVSNEGANRLYLNRGGFRFDDVTETAGVAGSGNWSTGVTMADVDGDGRLDIYVTAVGGYLDRDGRNQLFVNEGPGADGIPRFSERAAAYGLDFRGYGSHAAFFDYDRDGDLDVYLVNHSTHAEGTFGNVRLRDVRHDRAGDRLLRNDAAPSGRGRRFTDVTEAAGIYGGVTGYGLSVTVRDFDADGWPDVFVANDFHEDDFLYFNDGDGTFTEAGREAFRHTSYSSMGSDAADFNNDGRTDLVVLDMMPTREDVRKTSAPPDGYALYDLKRKLGYHHQYPANVLHLAEGRRRFSEIARLAGVAATDWSWSPLFADLDNDGFLDLFVTNGIYRRPNDLDYVDYIGSDEVQAAIADGVSAEELAAAHARMPRLPLANHAFRNDGGLIFTDAAADWGLDAEGFTTGAVYVDLDDDGDLDLVLSNLQAAAVVYENRAETLLRNHHLTVKLEGEGVNTGGVGARVVVHAGGRRLTREAMPARGWMSSVDPRLHFGLGAAAVVDTLTVVWPDGRFQVSTGVRADQALTLRQADARGRYAFEQAADGTPLFEDVTSTVPLDYRHDENTYLDFNREKLMPHRLSTQGPALAVADVDGDGLDDFFVGSAKWRTSALLRQQPDGGFVRTGASVWQADSLHEDVDAAFFDADADGDPDLYVVSGGNEFWGEAEALRDRLYLNDGRGGFVRSEGALPPVFANGACVRPADYDGDGDVDLFVGSRVAARKYGVSPTSYLLENDGSGTFRDVTATRADGLAEAGMVTDAAWADVDGDGRLDLVVVGEWMPLRVFVQQHGRFVERTAQAGLAATTGWWNAVAAADLDADGDVDLVAGNAGWNMPLETSEEAPVRVHVRDFDGDGGLDQVLSHVRDGRRYAVATRDRLVDAIPSIGERFDSYADFGARTLEDLFPPAQLTDAEVREARTFATSYAENRNDGTFAVRPLPARAQLAPVFGILVDDVDRDGALDVVLGGNFTGAEPTFGRFDASRGVLLRGDGRGGFSAVPPAESGLWLDGEVRALRVLRRPDGRRWLLAARNDGPVQLVRFVPPAAARVAAR